MVPNEFYNVTEKIYEKRKNVALFMSAGGYHHHVGANIRHSKRGSPPPENSPGLISYTINIPDKLYLDEVIKAAKESNLLIEKQDGSVYVVKDFDSNKIKLTL